MNNAPYLTGVDPDMFICPHCNQQHVRFYAEAVEIYKQDFVQRVDAIVAWLVSHEIELNPQKARDLAIVSLTMNINYQEVSQKTMALAVANAPATVPASQFKTEGYIYFVRVPGEDRVKIGFSSRVNKRLNALSTHMGQPLDVLLVIPGTREDEHNHHTKWSYARKRGEWFEVDDELRVWINLRAKEDGFTSYRIG